MKKEYRNLQLKEDLENKLREVYDLMTKSCIENNSLFREKYFCGIQQMTKLEIKCKYRHYLQCQFKNGN